jgi:hypothetical protein
MATNEHKNLSNSNIHNPKDFSTATNSTVLTKDSSGALVWASQGTLNTNIITLRGFAAPSNSNYYFPVSMNNNKDLSFGTDYGSATIAAANTITVSNMLRMSIFLADKDYTISQAYGWVSGTVAETVTFALIKGDNVAANTSDVFTVGNATNGITILGEFTASTYGFNTKLGAVDETNFTVTSLSKGDFLLPLIKSAGGANDTYFNLTITLKAS